MDHDKMNVENWPEPVPENSSKIHELSFYLVFKWIEGQDEDLVVPFVEQYQKMATQIRLGEWGVLGTLISWTFLKNDDVVDFHPENSSSGRVAKKLIEAGWSVNEKNFDGGSLLLLTAYFQCKVVTEWLIEKGLSVNEPDQYGRNFFMILLGGLWDENEEKEQWIAWCQHQGMSWSDRDVDGQTILDYARKNVHGKLCLAKLEALALHDQLNRVKNESVFGSRAVNPTRSTLEGWL